MYHAALVGFCNPRGDSLMPTDLRQRAFLPIPLCLTRWAVALRTTALVALISFAVGFRAHAADTEWSAGIASVKITPEKPVRLAGYAARVKPFEKVDLDIYAKALALRDAQG